jgi:hypothetical protein
MMGAKRHETAQGGPMKNLLLAVKIGVAMLLLVAGLAATPAAAVPLAPGTSSTIFGSADPFVGATLQATISAPFTAFDFAGIITQQVYTAGSLPGVSFRYTIVTDVLGTAAIERLTMSFFSGLYTDLGYVAGSGTSDAPLTVSRQASGASVGFTWATNKGIAPDTISPFLYILTNAAGYETGGVVSLMNGAVASVGVYKPVGVPEPMSLLLVGSGIAALGMFWRRRVTQQRLSTEATT